MGLKERVAEAINAFKDKDGTVPDLAEKVGVSRSAIYQWLAGDTKNLKNENLYALAKATGYSAEWIGTGKGDKTLPHDVASGGLDLSFLTATIEAVEEYLDKHDLVLDPTAKSKLVVLLYEIYSEKGRVEQPAVARYLRLVA